MSQILKNLRVKKFRQLDDFSVDCFGDVNLIVGGNNVGKSTLLDAIRFFASQGSPAVVEDLLFEHGELGFPTSDMAVADQVIDKSIANLFNGRVFPKQDSDVLYVGEKEATKFVQLEHVFLKETYEERDMGGEITSVRRLKRVAKSELSISATEEFIESIEFSCSEGLSLLGIQPRGIAIPLAELFNGRPMGARGRYEDSLNPIPASFVSARLGSHADLAEAWDAIVLTDGEKYALNALRLIEPETTGIAFIQQARIRAPRSNVTPYARPRNERSAVLKTEASEWPVPLQSMGDGMTRVLQIILSAFRAKNGFLLIDEIENGLHYSVQAKVWGLLFELARQNSIQIFATTHSQDAVNAFAEVATQHELHGELIRMERDGGGTVASNVSEDALLRLNQSNIEVR